MMNSFQSQVCFALIGVGLVLATTGHLALRSESRMHPNQNAFGLKQSAYGKLLARLSETTIDRVWHLGVEQVAPHSHDDHGHDHGHHTDHDPIDHDDLREALHAHRHNHPSAHGLSDHSHEEDNNRTHNQEHDQLLHVHTGRNHLSDHAQARTAVAATPSETERRYGNQSFMQRAKDYYGEMSLSKLERTNPYSLSKAHRDEIARDVNRLLLRSFNMDPSHYGAYNSYHLFLTIHDFGGTDATRKQAKRAAEFAIRLVQTEREDPEPWLTAASAAMNLYQLESEYYITKGKPIPAESLRGHRDMVTYCLHQFRTLYLASEESGAWADLSIERQKEIASRFQFITRLAEPFDVMIARAEKRRNSTSPAETETKALRAETEL